jgi:hypothetical protein
MLAGTHNITHATTICRLDNILSWFRHRITYSNAEGFNSRSQAIKSNARSSSSSKITALGSSSAVETYPWNQP